jgi:hypothetical protein
VAQGKAFLRFFSETLLFFMSYRLPLQSFWAEYTGAAQGIGQKP